MDSQVRNEPSELVREDFRELVAQKKMMPNERSGSWIRVLLNSVRLSSATDLLESSSVSLTAACLCLVLGGLFLIHRHYAQTDASADAGAADEWESLQVEPTSVTEVGEETEANGLPDSLIQYGPSGATEAFTIRVGAFRDASNAKRVAESLQKKSLDVRTVLRADGLHVVTLGPFLRKGAAEEAARSVRETLGLVPQVLRSNLR